MRMNRRGFLRAVVASPVAVLGVPEKKRVVPAVKEIPATVMAQVSSAWASTVGVYLGSEFLHVGSSAGPDDGIPYSYCPAEPLVKRP